MVELNIEDDFYKEFGVTPFEMFWKFCTSTAACNIAMKKNNLKLTFSFTVYFRFFVFATFNNPYFYD